MVASDPTAADPRPAVRMRLPQRPRNGPDINEGGCRESAGGLNHNGERNERALLRLQEIITPADPEVGRERPPFTGHGRVRQGEDRLPFQPLPLDKLTPPGI